MLELLDREKKDFNFSVFGIAPALGPLLDESDLPRLLDRAIEAEFAQDDDARPTAVADLLAYFEPDTLIDAARSRVGSPLPSNLVKMLCQALSRRQDKRSFDILAEFILEGHDTAVSDLYLHLPRDKAASAALVSSLSLEHVRAIWRGRRSFRFWDACLRRLCRLRADFGTEVASIARRTEGIERIALLFCLDADPSVIREELEQLASLSDVELAQQPFDIFSMANLDWTGTGPLYPRLLTRRIEHLRTSLLGRVCPCNIAGLGPLGADAVIRIANMAAALHGEVRDTWLKDQLGSIVGRYGDKDLRGYLLDRLANGKPRIRHWVKDHVVPYTNDISTDDMSEDAIAFLLADLSRANALSNWHNPLGRVASERFVTERLIPLARGASDTVLKNLRIVLKAAGDRHGRRFFLSG